MSLRFDDGQILPLLRNGVKSLFRTSLRVSLFLQSQTNDAASCWHKRMVKVVDFKDRAIERIGEFRANARSLPMLAHARYLLMPDNGQKSSNRRVHGVNFALRKHKPHQMHTQHRDSCVLVLQWLVNKLDVRNRECVFVNPSRAIRRPPYVPEIARETGLNLRTVTRCLASLARSRYLLRTAKRFFISLELFRDLKLDLTYNRLVNQLSGLAKKNGWTKSSSKPKAPPKNPTVSATPPVQVITPIEPLSEERRNANRERLRQLKSTITRSPPPEPAA